MLRISLFSSNLRFSVVATFIATSYKFNSCLRNIHGAYSPFFSNSFSSSAVNTRDRV